MSDSTTMPFILFANLQPTFFDASHTFSNWNTAADGSGTSYSDGAQYSFNTNLVLYAQWSLMVVDTFSFSANGGSGVVPSINAAPGSTITIPGSAGFIRAGYVLTDWNTNANGSGTKFQVGEIVTATETTVLYAQWSGHKLATLFGAIGTFKSGSSSLSSALKSQINRVAITIRSRKYLKVDLFGYTATTGLRSLNVSLSRARAHNVAIYLRNRLNLLKVRGVSIYSTGEGAISGQSSNAYSRVEVFGV
jgi:flagellar motor protein MotB